MVSWREQPNRYDIEAIQANTRRVGLVIKIRWTLIAVLALYSVLAGALYATNIPAEDLAQLMAIPALALLGVVGYNTFYTLTYKRLGNIAVWNNLQLGLDAIVVTVLVYFSGGVNSWFWSMFALFILEGTFILPRPRDAWGHAAFSVALLGIVEISELFGVLPHIDIPFAVHSLHSDAIYVAVRYTWQVAVLLGTAWIATQIANEFRRELAAGSAQQIIDETTGLYSRPYFMRACAAEIRRAQRDHRQLHVMLVDIDHFGAFNDRFGIDAGDEMLRELAQSLLKTLEAAGDVAVSTNLAARFGGEEFAVIFAEDSRATGTPSVDDAVRLAEAIRQGAEAVRVMDAGVAVSLGIASVPEDGLTVDAILDAADGALAQAIEAGGNRVVVAGRAARHSAGEVDLDFGV
jgi:diguanylate cyclase (GGDEF)-like protein